MEMDRRMTGEWMIGWMTGGWMMVLRCIRQKSHDWSDSTSGAKTRCHSAFRAAAKTSSIFIVT